MLTANLKLTHLLLLLCENVLWLLLSDSVLGRGYEDGFLP